MEWIVINSGIRQNMETLCPNKFVPSYLEQTNMNSRNGQMIKKVSDIKKNQDKAVVVVVVSHTPCHGAFPFSA